MPSFKIWSEGYSATGNSAGAHFHGEAKGEDFEKACRNFASKEPEFAKYFDKSGMTYWGCRLFDNESDARQSYG